MSADEEVASALAILDARDARTEQRERWLREFAERGYGSRTLEAMARTWAGKAE